MVVERLAGTGRKRAGRGARSAVQAIVGAFVLAHQASGALDGVAEQHVVSRGAKAGGQDDLRIRPVLLDGQRDLRRSCHLIVA